MKKIQITNIIHLNDKCILKSNRLHDECSYYSNTTINSNVLSLRYGIDDAVLYAGNNANNINEKLYNKLISASGRSNLEIWGVVNHDTLYHIKNGSVKYINANNDKKLSTLIYTLHVLSSFDLDLSLPLSESGAFEDDEPYYTIDMIVSECESTFNDLIFKLNNNQTITQREINIFYALREIAHGCDNVTSFLSDWIEDSRFDLRERFQWIDSIGIELQVYEKELTQIHNMLTHDGYKKAC